MVDVLERSGARRPGMVLATTPTNEVSAAQMQAPYTAIAQAVGFLGDRLEEAALPFHRAAGGDAVTLDSDGMPQVAWRFELTAGDRAHNAAARQAALAKGRLLVGERMLEMRRENEGDPAGFKVASESFAKTIGKGDPLLRPFLQEEALTVGAQHYAGLTAAQEARDYQSLARTWLQEEAFLKDQAVRLAIQGGTETDEFRRTNAKLTDIRNQKGAHPKFAYGPQERAQDDERDAALWRGAVIVGQVQRAGQAGGLAEADRLVNQLENDPGLSLRPEDRRYLVAMARDATREMNEERRIQRADIRARAQAVEQTLRTGAAVADDVLDGLGKEAAQNGDVQTVTRLAQASALNRSLRDFGGLDLAAKVRRTRETGSGLLQAGGRAVDGELAGVVSRIIGVESGGNATAQNPRSSATGAGQFIESTWLDMLDRHRPDLAQGRSRTELLALRNDPALSREMTLRYAEDNRQRLLETGLAATPGNLYLAHFAGSAGARALLRSATGEDAAAVLSRASGGRTSPDAIVRANPFLKGMTAADVIAWADRKMGGAGEPPGQQAALFNAYRQSLHADLKRRIPDLIDGIGRGARLEDPEINSIADAIGIVGDIDLARRFASAVAKAEGETAAEGETGPRQSAILARLQAAMRGGSSQLERDYTAGFEQASRELQAGLKADWLGMVPRVRWTLPGGEELATRATAPLDFTTPGALTEQFRARTELSKRVQERFAAPAGSLIRPSEFEALKTILASGDPTAIANVFGAIAGLDEAYLDATIRDEGFAKTLSTLTATRNPALYRPLMTGLDQIYRRNPTRFIETFRASTVDRLQDWQAGLATDTDDDIAKRLTAYADGRQNDVIKALEQEAQKHGRTLTTADITERLKSKVPGFQPGDRLPMDSGARIGLEADFRTLLTRRYVATGNMEVAEDQALEQLAKVYQFSPANGGKITKHPPEKYYPTIDRSHDWIPAQIEERLNEHLHGDGLDRGEAAWPGSPRTAPPAAPTVGFVDVRAGVPGTPMRLEVPLEGPSVSTPPPPERAPIRYELVAVPTTEADIKAGRLPRYSVVYSDPYTGRLSAMEWRGDVTRASIPVRERFERARARQERDWEWAAEATRRAPSLDALNNRQAVTGEAP